MRQLTHIGASNDKPKVERARVQEIAALRFSVRGELLDGASWPCAPAALVRIYEIGREWSIPAWLCPAAAVEMQKRGWKLLSHRAPPFDDLACDLHRDGPCPPRPAR